MQPWYAAIVDVTIPSAAILISASVAIWLARAERRDNRASLRRERLLTAATPLFGGLAELNALDPYSEELAPVMRALRGQVATFRAALDPDDALIADWIGLRHQEGSALWYAAVQAAPPSNFGRMLGRDTIGNEARAWANETLQQLQGWLSRAVATDWFVEGVARLEQEAARRKAIG